ncbi:peptidase family C78-domain-containing protein [Phycomyces nitens]|nr:peptidase family C78-domain-containing protein [Phycomyces nitens]
MLTSQPSIKDEFCTGSRKQIEQDLHVWDSVEELESGRRMAGVVSQLDNYFNQKASTATVYLSSPQIDYVTSRLANVGWDCGYRNCQILMSFLQTNGLLNRIGDIGSLQICLEKAWDQDYDTIGANLLNKCVYKTSKWIGTTEVHTIFTYLGIRTTILDFSEPSGPKQQHDLLLDWIQSYFATNQSPPLYLQYSGHSVTVIGIEITSTKRNLLLLDPQRHWFRAFSSKSPSFFKRPFRMHPREISRHPQYQILVLGRVTDKRTRDDTHGFESLVWEPDYWLTDIERDAMKVVSSVRAI